MPYAITQLLLSILSIASFLVFVWVIMSLLMSFDIINRYNPLVQKVYNFLQQLLNPVLKPIQKVIPTIGGIDLSPLVLILGIEFLKNIIISL